MIMLDALCCSVSFGLAEEDWGRRSGKLHQVVGLIKAVEAAAQGQLVPDAELGSLTARMHVSRGGQMAAYGDDRDRRSETKVGLEQEIRERAYLLWEKDGCPAGYADEYWHRALNQHLRERAYALWQQAGSPEGREDEYWNRVLEFEAQ